MSTFYFFIFLQLSVVAGLLGTEVKRLAQFLTRRRAGTGNGGVEKNLSAREARCKQDTLAMVCAVHVLCSHEGIHLLPLPYSLSLFLSPSPPLSLPPSPPSSLSLSSCHFPSLLVALREVVSSGLTSSESSPLCQSICWCTDNCHWSVGLLWLWDFGHKWVNNPTGIMG